MRDNKIVLVLEKSSENLGVTKDGNDIVLEGIFAQFGVVNNNDRIYEENEYLPHLEYLNKKIGKKNLLGELDHPDKFDVSLSKVSHVVEKLEYDKAKRQILGRVRLLDTPSGKIAKELVEAGVPISISSRAAGLVESNKKVKIKKIFTYDLVADPGFENAVLTKMNESLGILNENVAIYDVTSKYPDLLEDFDDNASTQTADTKTKSERMEYVTSEELNTYSLILKEEIEGINKKIESLSENAELASQVKSLSESIEKMQSYIDYLANTVDQNVQYSEYVAEKLDKVIDYADYVGKTLDESIQFSNYVAEKTDKSIQYGEYLREQIEKGIAYSEYLKECIEQGVTYTEYIAEQLDKGIQYTEYVAENASKGIEYSEYVAEKANELSEKLNDTVSYTDYLGESLNKGIAYTEYVGEQTQQLSDYTEFMLNENGAAPKSTPEINESKSTPTDYKSLTDKVDSLIESIKKKKVDDTNTALDEAKKQKVSNALNENSQQNADNLVNGLLKESQEEISEKWLTDAPEEYKTLWESLDSSTKNTINAQSKFYKLESSYQIKNFWETRKLNKGTEVINESKETDKLPTMGYSTSYLENIKNGLDRFGKRN
jgi:methyl-accepting chemotaxis protein